MELTLSWLSCHSGALDPHWIQSRRSHISSRQDSTVLRKQCRECSLLVKDIPYQPGHFDVRKSLQTSGCPGWHDLNSVLGMPRVPTGEKAQWAPGCLSKNNVPAPPFPKFMYLRLYSNESESISSCSAPVLSPVHGCTFVIFVLDDFAIEFAPRTQVHFPTYFH